MNFSLTLILFLNYLRGRDRPLETFNNPITEAGFTYIKDLV